MVGFAALAPVLQQGGAFGADFLGGGGAGAPLFSDAGDGDFNFSAGGSFAVGHGATATTVPATRAPQFATAGFSGGGVSALVPLAIFGVVAWMALR